MLMEVIKIAGVCVGALVLLVLVLAATLPDAKVKVNH